MSTEFFEYYNPTRIVFGANSLEALGKYIVGRIGGNLALILVDTKTFLGCRDLLRELTESLKSNGIEYVVYDKIPLNPNLSDLEEAVKMYSESYADLIVGFGGLNAVDSAKIIAGAISLGGILSRVVEKYDKITTTPPIVVVPSSHGNGMEVSGYTRIISGGKVYFAYSNAFYPRLTILDPRITLKTPLNISSLSVVEALTNALSALTSVNASEMSNLYSTAGIKTIIEYHRLLLENPGDLRVRGKLLWASMIAGRALDLTGPGLAHVIAHTFTILYPGLYYAKILSAILPAWIKRVLPRTRNRELIARTLNTRIENIADSVNELLNGLKASMRLSDMGLTRSDVMEILRHIEEGYRVDAKTILEESL